MRAKMCRSRLVAHNTRKTGVVRCEEMIARKWDVVVKGWSTAFNTYIRSVVRGQLPETGTETGTDGWNAGGS
jgi:hypothetical protein